MTYFNNKIDMMMSLQKQVFFDKQKRKSKVELHDHELETYLNQITSFMPKTFNFHNHDSISNSHYQAKVLQIPRHFHHADCWRAGTVNSINCEKISF